MKSAGLATASAVIAGLFPDSKKRRQNARADRAMTKRPAFLPAKELVIIEATRKENGA